MVCMISLVPFSALKAIGLSDYTDWSSDRNGTLPGECVCRHHCPLSNYISLFVWLPPLLPVSYLLPTVMAELRW